MPSGKRHSRPSLPALAALFVLAVAGGCTHAPGTPQPMDAADNDPLEPFNRVMFQINYTIDGVILRPITQIYRGVVPEAGRMAVSHVLDNLYSPVTFANSVLQLDPQNSFATFWRFMLNSTFGLGGIHDFAAGWGLRARPADFGETLAMCGVEPGPYIVLPIIGPSNLRDATGRAADGFMNPLNYADNAVSAGIWGATAIDARYRNSKVIDEIYSSSLDPYATFRSGYSQKRASDIRRAEASQQKALARIGSK